MFRIFTLAGCTIALLLGAIPGHASLTQNGTVLNGINPNGLTNNGLTNNGLTNNGRSIQGTALTGTASSTAGALRVLGVELRETTR